METKQVVLCGALGEDRVCWRRLGEEFGLDFLRATTLGELRDFKGLSGVHAVFVEVEGDWEAIETGLCAVRTILPRARILLCHGMSCPLEAEDFDALGAFHTLARPLDPQEVRQGVGFLWEALRREDEAPARRDCLRG